MYDFEKGLQKSIKKNFENSVIDGCYFHFVKILWAKAKNNGLCTKKYIKNTKVILFIFKLMPFIDIDKRAKLFDKLKEYFSMEDNKYKNLITYYKNNWLENAYNNYAEIGNDEYLNRTNNFLESFHGYMNQKLESYHPKISYLIEKYSEYLISVYEKIKNSLVNKIEPKIEKFSIIKDIIRFIKNMNEKYSDGLNLINILQRDEEDSGIINKVCKYLMEFYFDIECDCEESEDADLENPDINNENYDEKKFKNENFNNEESLLIFEEFFPIQKVKRGKKQKTTYIKFRRRKRT